MRKLSLIITTAMMLLLIACGGHKASSVADDGSDEVTTDYQYTAKMNILGATYQPQGVSVVKDGLIYYSEWEDSSMEIICEDPACEHKSKICSARVDNPSVSFVYGDKRYILEDGYDDIEIVNGTDRVIYEKSSLIEADMAGNNRKTVLELNCAIPVYSGLVYADRLYIGSIQTTYEHELGGELIYDEATDTYIQNFTSTQNCVYVILCIDLTSFEVTEIYKSESVESETISLYADEKAVYALIDSIDSINEDYTMTEYSYALYQIEGVNCSKIKSESLTNLACGVYGVVNGKLYFRYSTFIGEDWGDYEGIFRIADGQIEKVEGKEFFYGIVDGKTYVSTVQDDGKIRYDFQELDSDKLVETITYDKMVSYGEAYWGKLEYILDDYPETGSRYFIDVKDIKNIGKQDKLLYNY